MMQRYYFFCNHVSFSNGFWVSVLRPPPQGLSVAPKTQNKIETFSLTFLSITTFHIPDIIF